MPEDVPSEVPPPAAPDPLPPPRDPEAESTPVRDLGPGPGINIGEEFGTAKRNLPPAKVVAIVLGVGLARLFSLPVKVEPLAVGKASTVVQVGYIGLTLLMLTLHTDQPVLMLTAAIIATAFTLMSWFSYGQVLLTAFLLGRRPV